MTERDYVAVNREGWTRANADYTDRQAHGAWAQTEITWGQWSQPESEIRILPDVTGLDVVELGCGTAYFGAWFKRAGARKVVGVDVTPAQLETARRMDEEAQAKAAGTHLPSNHSALFAPDVQPALECRQRVHHAVGVLVRESLAAGQVAVLKHAYPVVLEDDLVLFRVSAHRVGCHGDPLLASGAIADICRAKLYIVLLLHV